MKENKTLINFEFYQIKINVPPILVFVIQPVSVFTDTRSNWVAAITMVLIDAVAQSNRSVSGRFIQLLAKYKDNSLLRFVSL